MSRVIKFRAWDVEGKQMIDIGEPASIEWSHTDGVKLTIGDNFHDDFIDSSIKKYELMQGTGLVDRNGKEIYEGDIVDTQKGIQRSQKAQVVWASFRWYFKMLDLDPDGRVRMDWLDSRWQSICEVIGNIYETPGQGT